MGDLQREKKCFEHSFALGRPIIRCNHAAASRHHYRRILRVVLQQQYL